MRENSRSEEKRNTQDFSGGSVLDAYIYHQGRALQGYILLFFI